MKKTFKDLLEELNACEPAIEWAQDKTIEEVITDVHRGDWLLWLASKVGISLKEITLAKALCAKTVIHLMKDERSIKAVEIAEKFGLGLATREELNAHAAAAATAAAYAADADAAAAAYAAAYAADADAAAAAYAAADADAAAAAYAADAADAAAAAYAAYAADAAAAAYAAAADADAAAYAAYAAAAAAAYAAYARIKNQKETAEICRKVLGELIINRANKLLTEQTNY